MNWAKLFSVLALGNFLIFYQPSAAESDSSGEGEEKKLHEIPLVFGWIEKPPYATPPTNGSLDNEAQGMIRDAISPYILMDCGYNWGKQYQVATKKFESEFEMIELLRQNKVHVALPIFENPENRKYIDLPFFKLDDYHGTEFITTEDDTTALTVVMDSVLKSWPLLAVLLVLTAIAGIIMWALDTYWNSEEFPRSFIKGSWDGFWWSFISMTTVGYGDKSPKSFVARIFSIIWIMMGLIVMAIFTASVTSALTAASLDLEPSNLEGYKIAVLGNGTEYQHALLEDAHPAEYKNIEDIVQAMNTDEVDGMMLDHYTASYYQQRDKLKSFVTVTNFELRREVGLLFSEDRRFIAECFLLYRSNIWRLAQTITGTFKLKQQKSTKSVSLFDDSSLLIKQFLYTSLGILGVLVLAGMLWELFVKKKVKIRKDKVVEAVNPGFSFSSQREAIRYDVEATRQLFKRMEEHFSKLEFKVSKL